MERQRSGASQDARNWGGSYARATGMRTDDVAPPHTRQAEPDYKVSVKNGEPHARKRHTHEGIWKAGEALTDHPAKVAVFASESDFQAALAAMPTDPREWWSVSSDRRDAQVGDVHYQAILLGDTMDLTSCYPTRGREYPKGWLNGLLRRHPGRNSQEFWAFAQDLDDLWAEWESIKDFPPGASTAARETIAALRSQSEGELRDGRAPQARKTIAALKAAWDKEKERAAAAVAAEKQREAEKAAAVNETRVALNKAIEAKNVELAKTLYLKMREFRVFISPPAIAGLKSLGIDAVSD